MVYGGKHMKLSRESRNRVILEVLSALREVALAAKRPERAMLFRSRMRLGQDMIGTMSNTLIFASTGGVYYGKHPAN